MYRTDFPLFEGSDPINLMMTESADHVVIMPMAKVADLAAEIGRLLDEESSETDKWDGLSLAKPIIFEMRLIGVAALRASHVLPLACLGPILGNLFLTAEGALE